MCPERFLATVVDAPQSCPECGYILHAALESRYPECGAALALGVVSAGRRGTYVAEVPFVWLVLLTTSALIAGVGIRRWAVYLANWSEVVDIRWRLIPWYFLLLDGLVLASPLLLTFVLLKRRWLAHQPTWLSWLLAGIALAINLVEMLALL